MEDCAKGFSGSLDLPFGHICIYTHYIYIYRERESYSCIGIDIEIYTFVNTNVNIILYIYIYIYTHTPMECERPGGFSLPSAWAMLWLPSFCRREQARYHD